MEHKECMSGKSDYKVFLLRESGKERKKNQKRNSDNSSSKLK